MTIPTLEQSTQALGRAARVSVITHARVQFRLAAVLRLRQRIRDQKHWELSALHETRGQMLAELDTLKTNCPRVFHRRRRPNLRRDRLRLRADYGQSFA